MLPLQPLRQSDGYCYCGPTSLRMVLAYYDRDREQSEEELARLVGATPEMGCNPQDLVRGAQKLGFSAEFREESTLEELERLVNKEKIPVIVDWLAPVGDHYSVVVGVGPALITLADPYLGRRRRIPREAFLEHWIGYYHLPPRDLGDVFLRGMVIIKPEE